MAIWSGIFNGHFKPTEADKINRIGQLRMGVIKVIEDLQFSPDVSKKYTVADMNITTQSNLMPVISEDSQIFITSDRLIFGSRTGSTIISSK